MISTDSKSMVGDLEILVNGCAKHYFGAYSGGDSDAIAATSASFSSDGYWKSGDLCSLSNDKKTLTVLGRVNDNLDMYFEGDSRW